jgi:uncharacterized protein (TIGR02271 family)
MYDSRSEAEAASEQLRSRLGINARIVDQSSSGGMSSASGSGTSGSDSERYGATEYDPSASSSSGSSSGGRGFWAELKDAFVSDDDRSTYEEGVRRGHFLLTASVSEEQADKACDLLDQSKSFDMDSREQQWRGEGWTPRQSLSSSGGGAIGQGSMTQGSSGQAAMGGENRNTVEEERIPIIEEALRVGKREVSRGGARVRSYVEETPVDESVSLHEEHVNVERRPVDRTLGAAELKDGNLFRDQTIEMRETAEEAVVAKEARVKEEVVVSKTATDRTEQIHDTVRHTKVDVDEGLTDGDRTDRSGGTTDRGAFGFDKR